jgi:hypothetical protein
VIFSAPMRKVLSVLLLATAASAKPVHAPLPPEAYTAKTIAIINHTGKQSVTDSAYEELQKWGRYTVVSDPAKADMVLTVGVQVHSTGATANMYGGSTTVTENKVADITTSFYLNGQQEPFFSETERANIFRKSATKRCVDDFRKRIEETPKP